VTALTLLPAAPRAVRCSAPGCGRLLTRPDSIAAGQGPVCWARAHPAQPWMRRRAVMAAQAPRRPTPADGQLKLDLPTMGDLT
jgi:hypothetical protein